MIFSLFYRITNKTLTKAFKQKRADDYHFEQNYKLTELNDLEKSLNNLYASLNPKSLIYLKSVIR